MAHYEAGRSSLTIGTCTSPYHASLRPCRLAWHGRSASLFRIVVSAQQGPIHYGELIAFHLYSPAKTTETGDRPRPFSKPSHKATLFRAHGTVLHEGHTTACLPVVPLASQQPGGGLRRSLYSDRRNPSSDLLTTTSRACRRAWRIRKRGAQA